jgi:peptidoglycan/LPS O-acetylase OafA/YrhL
MTRLFWFASGMIFARHITAFRDFLQRWKSTILTLTVILFVAGVLEWEFLLRTSAQPWIDHRETIIDSLYSAGVISCLLAYTNVKLPMTTFLNTMGSRSYGIYLAHIPVMEIVARGIYHALPEALGMPLFFMGFLTLMGLGIPLALMKTFRSTFLVRVYSIAFG